MLNVAVIVHHRLNHAGAAISADVPLQKAYPQHQLGQRSGALVQLHPAQLLQGHGLAAQVQRILRIAQGVELVQHLALQALEVLQRHIQKVGTAAGRVQHTQGTQPVQKILDLLTRLGPLGTHGGVVAVQRGKVFFDLDFGRVRLQLGGLVRQQQGSGLGVGPLGAQGLNHGGQHQALHIGARRVMCAQGVALGGVQRTLQQSAKNSRLHLAPIGPGGLEQQIDLLGPQQQAVTVGAAALEQLAVEFEHVCSQRRRKTASVHVGPQDAQHLLQGGGACAVLEQQGLERALGQQLHILGKHGKQAARQVGRHRVGVVPVLLQRAGQQGQLLGHLPSDLRGNQRRV